MVSEIVKVLRASTASVELIPESFHVLHVSSKISVHMIGIGGWLHLKSCWFYTQVTENCFVIVWLLGTKHAFTIGPH